MRQAVLFGRTGAVGTAATAGQTAVSGTGRTRAGQTTVSGTGRTGAGETAISGTMGAAGAESPDAVSVIYPGK